MFCEIKMQYIDERQAEHNYVLYALENNSELCPSLSMNYGGDPLCGHANF